MATGIQTHTGTAKTRFESGDLSSMKQSEGQRHSEGVVARTIEDQTARIPSDVFLWSAMGCAGVSAMLHFSGDHSDSRFVGQWVAPLLIMGVYNKIVKVHGS